MSASRSTRRQLLQRAAGSALVTGLGGTDLALAEETPLKIGFIYVGPRDDFGYNQAHFQGKSAVASLPWVRAFDEEKVPETLEVQRTMAGMIHFEGVRVVFATSYGYFDPHVLKIAPRFPEVTFLHCGGLYREGKHPPNVGSYFGYIDEAQYLAGMVAGGTTRTGKLGFVAAKPIPHVLRNLNNYTLGARALRPDATTQVLFTGEWSLPVREAEAANSLIDRGVDVLTCHVDSPKVIVEICERRGVYCTGYHTNQAALAPRGYLTGAEWNWAKVYLEYADLFRRGAPIPHLVRGGLKDGLVKLSPYGNAVQESTRRAVDEAHAKFMRGTQAVYRGPIKDQAGKLVVPAGQSFPQVDLRLEALDWLVEGVLGSLP